MKLVHSALQLFFVRLLRILSEQSKNLQLPIAGDKYHAVGHDGNQIRIAAQVRPIARFRRVQVLEGSKLLAAIGIKRKKVDRCCTPARRVPEGPNDGARGAV